MADYLEYHKSIASEFKAYQNRVRNLIGNKHWGEEGRYKEIILMNYLKRVLPKNVSVGTGFVQGNNNLSTQIDIIIYDNTFPVLFSEGDFVVTVPENVVAIIEVKTKIHNNNLKEIVKKASNNGEIIFSSTQRDIFNGIFSYEYSDRKDHLKYQFNNLNYFTLPTQEDDEWIWTEKTNSQVNHILLGSSIFIKFYPYTRIRRANDFDVNEPHLNIYDMKNDLALAYFISNLQEFILYRTTKPFLERMPEELLKFFYPIPETKEIYLFEKLTNSTFPANICKQCLYKLGL